MKKKGMFCSVLAVLLTAAVFLLPVLNPGYTPEEESEDVGKSSYAITDKKEESSSAGDPVVPKSDEIVTFIVLSDGNSFIDTVLSSDGKYKNVRELLESDEIREYRDTLKKNQAVVKASIRRTINEASFDDCFTYNTVVSGFSVTAPYSCLSKLKKIGGVADVFLASTQNLAVEDIEDDLPADQQTYEEYEESPEIDDEETEESGYQTENDANGEQQPEESAQEEIVAKADEAFFEDAGFAAADREENTGAGQLIAFIDDSFFTGHEAFSVSPEVSDLSQQELKKLLSAAAFNIADNTSPAGNDKIIYAYDYAGRDPETYSISSSHGTMTAAAAAGNNGKTDSAAFRGIASDSQLVLMKVCPDGSRSVPDDVLLAALDDAAKLSPDVLNISLGVPRVNTNSAIFDAVYQKLSETGICIVASAGNDEKNTAAGTESVSSAYTDYSTISYPSGLPCVISAAASNSSRSVWTYITANGKEKLPVEKTITSEETGLPETETERDYIYIRDIFSLEEMPDLSGKMLVTDEGENNDELYAAAQMTGASALLVIPTEGKDSAFSEANGGMNIFILRDDSRAYFSEHETGTLDYNGKKDLFDNENAGMPTDFTSWGITSDFRLKPDISAPGTRVYSASNEGYDSISGTSVSSAGVSGMAALLSEKLSRTMPGIDSGRKNLLIRAMLQNTAVPASAGGSLYASPRLQGAGQVKISAALDSDAVLTCGEFPSASLGDNKEGIFTFELTIGSLSDKAETYKLSSVLQTDKLIKKEGVWYNTFEPEDIHKKSLVRFVNGREDISEITLEPGESKSIEVHVTLKEDFVSKRMQQAPNGFYTDGFIFLNSDGDGPSLSLPFTGYCGNWSAVSVFDATVYDDETPVLSGGMLCASALNGDDYPFYPLGQNMTTGEFSPDRICIGRDTMKNYLDKGSVGTSFIIPNTYLLRDAADFSLKITDSSGKELYSGQLGAVSAYARGDHAPYLSLLSGFNSDKLKNLFAELKQGKYIYTVSASAVSSDGSASDPQSLSFCFEVDNTPPSGLAAKTYVKKGRTYLELHAADLSGVQGFVLYTAAKSGKDYGYADKLDELTEQGYIDADSAVLVKQERDETTATYTYDITNLYHQLSRLRGYSDDDAPAHSAVRKIVYRAVDYAYNLSEPKTADTLVEGTVSYKLSDQNGKPVKGAVISMDKTLAESDKDGNVKFENVLPGLHEASLVSLPENYETDFSVDAAYVRQEKPEYSRKISVKFSGEYSEEPEETPEENEEKEEIEKKEAVRKQGELDKNPLVPLLFVGLLLLILVLSFMIGKLKRK